MVQRILVVLALLFLSLPVAAAEVKVFAAASLTDAMTEAARAYERTGGDRILFNFGGSGTLARQIAEGAPADLFASADGSWMGMLIKQGLVASPRASFLSNSLVLVVRIDDRRPVDLRKYDRIAMGDRALVPAGMYAWIYLQKHGLWKELAPKIISTENVRAALAAVAAGNVDAAFVYRTDAQRSRAVRIAWDVPDEVAIEYPFAVMRHAEQPAAAQRFLAWLQSPTALAIFRKHGFVTKP
jgi:molybdate transport system substrate-binding protein